MPYMGDSPFPEKLKSATSILKEVMDRQKQTYDWKNIQGESLNPCAEIILPPINPFERRKMNTEVDQVFNNSDRFVLIQAKSLLKDKLEIWKNKNPQLSIYNPILAGGMVAKAILTVAYPANEYWVSDFDIFFTDSGLWKNTPQEVVDGIVGDHRNMKAFKIPANYRKNPNVVYIADATCRDGKWQYIFNIQTRETMLNEFDFLHCRAWYDIFSDKLHISRKVYEAIVAQKLIVQCDKYTNQQRWNKWVERGFRPETVTLNMPTERVWGLVMDESSFADNLKEIMSGSLTNRTLTSSLKEDLQKKLMGFYLNEI